MSETKSAYKVGADGRLYFTYNQGAEYEVLPPVSTPFCYRILSCELDELTNKEYYRIESAGIELSARFSVSQVEFMLGRFPCEVLNEGEPVELPLLSEEVKAYYAAKRAELKKANDNANARLNGTPYKPNLLVIKNMKEKLVYYKTSGDEKMAAQTEKKLAELEAEQAKTLKEKKVDLKTLLKIPDCAKCNDRGVVDDEICACALEQAEKIKAYNAERRKLRGCV